MTELDDILAAFEENLVLARELGARSVELDRALLAPLPKEQPPSTQESHVSATAASPNPNANPNRSASPPSQLPASSTSQPLSASAPLREHDSQTLKLSNRQTLILLVGERMEGAAAELFAKMVAAMGCAEGETCFVEIPRVPSKNSAEELSRRVDAASPKAIVFLGREAMQTQALAGGTARRGGWGLFRGVQSIATYHPAFMLRFWAKDEQSLKKAKAEAWGVLKSALAKIGRIPPPRG